MIKLTKLMPDFISVFAVYIIEGKDQYAKCIV